jgi:hypothetical protein
MNKNKKSSDFPAGERPIAAYVESLFCHYSRRGHRFVACPLQCIPSANQIRVVSETVPL